MLYVLPPPRAPDPPSPWSSILCGDSSTSWDGQTRRPPRARLRNLQFKDEGPHQGAQDDNMDTNHNPKSLSECYFAGKGTALVLPAADAQKSKRSGRQGSNIQKHLQAMFYLLRPEETLKMAVKLESVHASRERYLVVISRMGERAEESCLLGIDCNETTTVGLVLKVMADTTIRLDGDGGFSVSVCGSHHIFKPVSVQAMWSALQTLHKVSSKAREENYYQSGLTHGWVDYYDDRIESDRSCLNEWHAMDNLESKRPPSPDSVRTKPTEREETERVIRTTLKEIMMSVDLDEVTSKYIRSRLEEDLDMDLGEYKSFIDQEMLTILGQMDAPTEIFDHVYLGSEWNASNYEELQRNGVGHILNVTREIDNFFPGAFDYLNVRVCDDEATNLLKHWDDTFKYITKARIGGSKVLVHCKMGVSRSASVVIAYAMKAYDWDFKTAIDHVKEKRTCIKPNASFISQLETYQGMLDAMKNKEKLQRSKSETNLKNNNNSNKCQAGGDVDYTNAKRQDLLQTALSGQDLRGFGARPKSWSPDNVEVVDKSPTFLSLEDLSQKDKQKASHVLMPRDNGESYSVSPNQIVHLQGQNLQNLTVTSVVMATSVKDIVSELESKGDEKRTWDPGDSDDVKVTSECDNDGGAIWTSSAVVLSRKSDVRESPPSRADPFSNQLDRVFDREEKKQAREENTIARDCPSRQSSWSSYDSAVVMEPHNDHVLSRHSSWGSGDTARTLPSRNSSWGSYDTKPRSQVHYLNEKGEILTHNLNVNNNNSSSNESSSGIFAYDREEIPWHPGTVKRTKQKIEEGQKSDSSETLYEYSTSVTLGTVEAINPVLVDVSAISATIAIPSENDDRNSSRLSVSAPVVSAMDLLSPRDYSLSRSASSTAQCLSVKQHRTFLESLRKENDASVSNRTIEQPNTSGLVKNLKKEFEAKTAPLVIATGEHEAVTGIKKVASLPSSPVSAHISNQGARIAESSPEELPFESLVGIFEPNRVAVKRAKVARPFSPRTSNNRNRHSCIVDFPSEHNKRPPIAPVVRNTSPGLVVATVIAKAAKKQQQQQQQQQQQYGKTHPLARLNIKSRHNSPVYNTM